MYTKLMNRNFTMVVIGQLISLFGNSILRFALSLYVLDLTGSAAVFGTVTAISIIPMILLSPFGGMIADRVNRRNIMVALDFITAFLVLGFGFTLSESNAIPFIAVMLILLSIIQSFYTPSVQSSVPLLQMEENLVRANSIVNQVTMLANLVGPVLGGLLYGFFGAMPIIIVSCICFFLSAILEVFIHIPHEKRQGKANILQTVKGDFAESMGFMTKEQPDILKTMLIIAAFNFLIASMINIGMPYMVRTVLKLSSELYGITEGLMAGAGIIGGIIAGVIANKFQTRKLYVLLIASGISIVPIGIAFLYKLTPMVSYGIITVCVMLMQLTFTVFSIFTLSATQKKTPTHLLGKVTAYIMTLTMCAQPIGQALYGVLFDMLSYQLYILLIATAAVAAIVGLSSKKIFSRLDSKEASPFHDCPSSQLPGMQID